MQSNLREDFLLHALIETADPTAPDDIEQTYRAHSGLVFRTAYRITGNAADAEDVLQTVFMRLFRRDAGAAPLNREESYLRRAAINASLDVVRARQKERGEVLTDRIAPLTPPHSGDFRESLLRALAGVKPMQAEIFSLRFFEERSNREIARTLGISQVRVAVILHRTRRQLQKALGPRVGDKR